jgi:hypothetical protein
MKQEHQPWDVHSFQSGSDSDTEKEFLGAENNGSYVDARNARHSGPGGSNGAMKKIGGESIVYPNNLPAGNYFCLIEHQIKDYHVEVWADESAVGDSLIRVNGQIVLSSPLFPITYVDPPQYDVNEDCAGGEIFLTAKTFTPLILNIKDMVDSLTLDPNKYFSAFNPELYSVNLSVALDHPVFVQMEAVGGGGGLPVGVYQYAMRYVSDSGDRTNWSVATPMIPVTNTLSSASSIHPYAMTYGGSPNPTNRTGYGPRLRFRVNNFFGYDYIEIKRISYNRGAGLGFTPIGQIIAKVAVSNNEVSVRDFIDPSDSNIDPPTPTQDTEEAQSVGFIEGAKTIRYNNRRLVLMNLKVASKESNLTFDQIDGKELHPVIENIGKPGFSDPWNFIYRRPYVHGERYGFAIQGFDGVFGKGFATKVTNGEDVEIPNRRDTASATTQLYSYGGTVKAATTTGTVDQTHEVFDLTESESKSDTCSFKNIYRNHGLALTGWKSKARINELCNEEDDEIENHGAKVTVAGVYPHYHPYTPVSERDPNTAGHNYVVNIEVSKNNGESASDTASYRPSGFAPNYYSQGMMLSGVDNIPAWMKSFSIARTDAAGKVVAQGLGMYWMSPAIYGSAFTTKSRTTKGKKKFWFFSPDIENGIVSSDLVNDIIDNPQNYKLQFVSPLGFFSEAYNFEENLVVNQRDTHIDVMSYARMIRDTVGGQINPMEDATMGISGGDGNRYVAYGKWRNQNAAPAFSSGDQGNNTFPIDAVTRIAEGRGTYLGVEMSGNSFLYNTEGTSGDKNFDEQGMKDWTEPFYIVNIIRDGATVPDREIESYRDVHYQKIESFIGRANGDSNQEFALVDERWEDCIPALSASHPNASIDRYVYIRKPNGVEEKWINVTFKTPAQISTIVNDINNLGAYAGDVKGIYTHTNTDNRFFSIVFNQAGFYPADEDLIIVKYDKTAPIRFWGGDALVGESLFAPIDRQNDNDDKNATDTHFAFGVGWPYRHIKMNPRHYVVKRTAGVNVIQDKSWMFLGYIRQMCVMFTVESRAAVHLAHNLDYPIQYFPLINYVMRPNRWEETKTIVEQNVWQGYVDDYGEQEKTQWGWGGFRFKQTINHEYSAQQRKSYFSKPKFGYKENTEFCTRVAHSLARQINAQDSPSLRSFPANNVFDIDDETGEIKYAFSANSPNSGENLYALTNKGVCMLLTGKSILSDLNGGDIAYMADASFIKGQYWLTKSVGVSDEMWRGISEGSMPMLLDENGTEARSTTLIFPNKDSVFMLRDNNIIDIGRSKYYTKIKSHLDLIQPAYGTKLTSAYDPNNKEYWLTINTGPEDPDGSTTLMYSLLKKRWIGYNDYMFDNFASVGNKVYSTRNGETYELDSGFIINGAPIVFELSYVSSKDPFSEKEFIRTRVNSERNQKPTSLEFYDKAGNILNVIDPSLGPLYLKWYDGWEQFIPRKVAPSGVYRERMQERLLITKIIHNLAGEFVVVSAGTQYKTIK